MTDFLQFLVAGVAVGALYALVALGFVIIYKATGVINFALGALALLGAYLTYGISQTWGVPFFAAAALAMVGCAGVALLTERLILSRMVGRPTFAVIMITVGLAIVIEQAVIIIWGGATLPLDDPWGLRTLSLAGVVVAQSDLARIVVAGVLLAGFFTLFRYTTLGVAMRAVASDQEAALAQGISVRAMVGITWGIAAAIATAAGVLLASGGRGVEPSLGVVALVAFPSVVLGGLDSPGGSLVGGAIMGVVEVMTAGYSERLPEFLGANFHRVTPYVVLVVILVVRPYGLFGAKQVQRV
ncbi:MAG: branched-chain amino acid ABC transporter permease [Actinobacteria bacterium]|nr:branched-chain amino acid ABC transporter permease [Actinomycetota bacterium]